MEYPQQNIYVWKLLNIGNAVQNFLMRHVADIWYIQTLAKTKVKEVKIQRFNFDRNKI